MAVDAEEGQRVGSAADKGQQEGRKLGLDGSANWGLTPDFLAQQLEALFLSI